MTDPQLSRAPVYSSNSTSQENANFRANFRAASACTRKVPVLVIVGVKRLLGLLVDSVKCQDAIVAMTPLLAKLVAGPTGRDFFAVSSAGLRNGSLGSWAIGVVSHSAGILFIGADETMGTLALAYNVTLI